jgi:3-oxoacyl-[acyl-carrier-protein] synthase II
VAVTGMGVVTAYGRGQPALLSGLVSSKPAFGPVTRFDVSGRRAHVAAALPDAADLATELAGVVEAACAEAGLRERADIPLYLAFHGDPGVARAPEPQNLPGAFASRLAAACGLGPVRVYTSACVAASTAVADAAAAIALGDLQTVVVAAGYLVEQDQFAIFDAGRALATDGEVRPFSLGRLGMVMGDGVAAVVLTSAPRDPLAYVSGWGRAGDAYHVCQPIPDGSGMARAIEAALHRAGLPASAIEYVNAHGSGSVLSDMAEAHALYRALGLFAGSVPVGSTKSLHGQSLEASPLVELVATVLTMRAGTLPVNAGFLAPDPDCSPLSLILREPLAATPAHALSLNSAFGGANTALIVSGA